MEQLLTVDEAAEITRLSAKTLYTYANKKRVPHIKLGSRLFFEKIELEAWIDSNRVPAMRTDVSDHPEDRTPAEDRFITK